MGTSASAIPAPAPVIALPINKGNMVCGSMASDREPIETRAAEILAV